MNARLDPPLRSSSRGSALILTILMVMMLTLEMAVISLVALRGLGEEGLLLGQNLLARRAADTELSRLSRDVYAYLESGKTPAEALTAFAQGGTNDHEPAILQATNPDGGTTSTGVTISGWVEARRGDNYYLVARAQVAGSDIVLRRWSVLRPSSANYDCTIVENTIKSGGIASLPNDVLIAYAQASCGVKKAPAGIAAYTVEASTGADGSCTTASTPTWSGTGPINRTTVQWGCRPTVTASGKIRITTLNNTDTTGAAFVTATNTSGSTAEYHIASGIGTDLLYGSTSTSPLQILLGTLNWSQCSGYGTIETGSSDDVISVGGGTYKYNFLTNNGNDTIISAGVWENPCDTSFTTTTGVGADTIYAKSAEAYFNLGAGNDAIYLGYYETDDTRMGNGDDLFSCTEVLGSGGCNGLYNVWIYGDANGSGTGDDFISVDGSADSGGPWPVALDGEEGQNIIYVKTVINSTNNGNRTGINASDTGSSLVIIGGNMTKTDITAAGTDNVLLVKSGVTITNTTVGGLSYNGSQTSLGGFTRILRY